MGITAGVETSIVTTTYPAPQPRVAALPNGGWVVIWKEDHEPIHGYGPHFQFYNADGSKNGTAQVYSGYSFLLNFSILALPDGGWLMVYDDVPDAVRPMDIHLLRFNANGSLAADYGVVNSFTTGTQQEASITLLEDGGWVITWTSYGQDAGGGGIYQQRYNANGTRLGAESLVHVNSPLNEINTDVAALADGGWVVTWSTSSVDVDALTYGQVFNSDGTKRGQQFQISDPETIYNYDAHSSVTGLADGNFVVFWHEYDIEVTNRKAYFSIYASDGTLLNGRNELTSTQNGGQNAMDVVALDNGGFVVTWAGEDGSGNGVYCQAYGPDGAKNGAAILVNTTTSGAQLGPIVTALAGGSWMIVWTDHSTQEIKQRVFTFQNDAPIGEDNTVQVAENGEHQFTAADFPFTDANSSGLKAIIITSLPAAGSLELDGNAVVEGQSIAAADITKLVWTPPADTIGSAVATFDFKVQDKGGTAKGGEDTDTAANTITLDVLHVNQAPTGADKTINMFEDHAHTFVAGDFGFSDSADGTYASNFKGIYVTGGSLVSNLELDGTAVSAGQFIKRSDFDDLVFRPDANRSGTLTLSFKVVDTGGTLVGGVDTDATANTITMNVKPVNDAPFGTSKAISLKEDSAYRFSAATFGFSDPRDAGHEDKLSKVIITDIGGRGDLLLGGREVREGQSIKASDLGKLTFTGDEDGFGQKYAMIKFKVVDDGGTQNGGRDTDATPDTLTFNLSDVVDIFRGSSKADRLSGTAGKDIMAGNGGDDILQGLAGADTFAFRTGDGVDIILDFNARGASHDILDIKSLNSITSFNDLLINHMSQTKGGVLIDGLGGDSIELRGVKLGDLDADDFLI